MAVLKQYSAAAERNRDPILHVLQRVLPQAGFVLEVASGTGQHVIHFAGALSRLTWQPSDPDPNMRRSIFAWLQEAELPNVLEPLELDVFSSEWPNLAADAVLCINMVHIAPWSATEHLMAKAFRVLLPGGILFLYGPYRRCGRDTAPSNQEFDLTLRHTNPEWGVRNLEEVVAVAERHCFVLAEIVSMPANNLSVIMRRE